eukprot:1159818-Pelagomonas_calceolata.AAC.3
MAGEGGKPMPPHKQEGSAGGIAGAHGTARSMTGAQQGEVGEDGSRHQSNSSSSSGSGGSGGSAAQEGISSVTANRQHAGGLPVSSSLSRVTCGIVFFATPHFGSDVAAMGWRLRHVPYASPAPSLARLTPGAHLYNHACLYDHWVWQPWGRAPATSPACLLHPFGCALDAI